MKKIYLLFLSLLSFVFTARSQNIFSENFDNVPTLLTTGGWTQINKSYPLGYEIWHNGTDVPIGSYNGGLYSYAEVSSHSVNDTAAGTIGNWLITPTIMLDNGYKVSFYTISVDNIHHPDRLELRLNTQNSTNVGSSDTSAGDFNILLLSVNPNLTHNASDYPESSYGQFIATISGLSGPTPCRIAFRYFVTNGGLQGSNSSYIGVDAFSVDGPNGINDLSSEKPSIRLYPNPTTERLTIDFAQPLAENGTASIYNAVGNLVFSFPITIGQFKESFSVKDLSNGFYTISLQTSTNVFRDSFIKQ